MLFAAVPPAGAAGRDAAPRAARVPQFADYPAGPVYRGTPAAPDFTRSPAAERYAAVLREGTRRGPNFAGELRIVAWSCGTSCQAWMLVNVKTGRIHEAPEPSAFALEFQLTSRLVVVTTVGRFTAADPPAGVPIARYYVWRNGRFERVGTRALRPASPAPR